MHELKGFYPMPEKRNTQVLKMGCQEIEKMIQILSTDHWNFKTSSSLCVKRDMIQSMS